MKIEFFSVFCMQFQFVVIHFIALTLDLLNSKFVLALNQPRINFQPLILRYIIKHKTN